MLVTTQCASYCRYCTRSPDRRRPRPELQPARARGPARLHPPHAAGPRRAHLRRRRPHARPEAPRVGPARPPRDPPRRDRPDRDAGSRSSCPQRIDDELCEMLAKYHPIWLNIHVNHPNEITPGARPRLRPARPGRGPAGQPVGAPRRRERLRPHPARRSSSGSSRSGSGPTTSTSATWWRAPATSGRRSARAWRSSRACAATPPATPSRSTSSTRPAAAGRSRSCPTT